MNPKVSVVMPVLNGGRYFAAAMGSVIAQDYDNFEIIVVDDGSTDGHTATIAQAFMAAHPHKIRYLHQQNQGVAAALNAGIAAATGEFFAWLSHDDLYTAQFISSQVSFFQSLGIEDACLHSNYSLIDANSQILARSVLDIDLYRRNPELGLLHSGINGCTVLIPIGLLRRFLPFDARLRYTQDYDLWGRVLQHHPFILNDADLVHYRMHDGQGTRELAATTEGDALWIRLLESQDELRRVQIFGSRSNFYAQMARFLDTTPYAGAASHARKMASISPAATRVSIALWVGDDPDANQRTYASILAQTHQNWELWLLASHWTTTTEALNDTIVDRSRITWIVADIGIAELGNRVLDVSRGDYCAFIRSGEWWAPDRLADQIEAMQVSGTMVSHGAHFVCLGELSSRRIIRRLDRAAGSGWSGQVSPFDVALPTMMVHRIVIANGLRFDAAAGDPWVLFVAWLCSLYDWHYLDTPLAEMMVGVDSPLLIPAERLAQEAEVCRLIPAADRIFASSSLLPDQTRAERASADLWAALGEGLADAIEVAAVGQRTQELPPHTLARLQGMPGRILIVTHAWGGGTDRFVRQQIGTFVRAGLDVLLLTGVEPDGQAQFHEVNAFGGIQQSFSVWLDLPIDQMAAQLRTLGIEAAAINSLVSLPASRWIPLKRAMDLAGIPYDVHLHDYGYVCPRLHMTLPDGRYCGAPALDACERCIAANGGLVPNAGVGRWRAQHGWLLSGARRVIAPHEDVRRRYQDYFPGLGIKVQAHSTDLPRTVRVVVMGHCGVHKGANTFLKVARHASQQCYPIEFIMLGPCDRAQDLGLLRNVRLMGAYPEGALVRLLQETQPDIAWFPGQAAETYSYTLSTAFDAGLFPIAFDVGAIADRIRQSGTGLVLPLTLAEDADAVCIRILQAGVDLFSSPD